MDGASATASVSMPAANGATASVSCLPPTVARRV